MTNKVYAILDHMADLPFTQEHISVKLCQLLVHDDFATGYNFNDGLVTPEEQLVWNCLMAWENQRAQGTALQSGAGYHGLRRCSVRRPRTGARSRRRWNLP